MSLADVDTPSGVMESTRISSQDMHNSRLSQSTDISNVTHSDKTEETDRDSVQEQSINSSQMTGNLDHSVVRSRQTPAEITAALSVAMGELDLEDFETITTPPEGNVDGTVDYTQFGSHHLISGSADHSALTKTNENINQSTTTTNSSNSKDESVSQPQNTSRSNRSSSSAPSQGSNTSSSQSKGPFICPVCNKQCATRAGLKSHQRKHK